MTGGRKTVVGGGIIMASSSSSITVLLLSISVIATIGLILPTSRPCFPDQYIFVFAFARNLDFSDRARLTPDTTNNTRWNLYFYYNLTSLRE
jgi:hypothetical protein